jgi:hypothetical protein
MGRILRGGFASDCANRCADDAANGCANSWMAAKAAPALRRWRFACGQASRVSRGAGRCGLLRGQYVVLAAY